ncbi:hypothetical protein NDU88_008073 [Pleurodeles waltl]|uniref:Uncharacterized protein n=1 Tax=Pleurodeles waltl TaxID=8319 RepID=A0AAV7PR25_PLEWA|nr:hypothetical protein NDU88_008073 [Pleurodeles waltl]
MVDGRKQVRDSYFDHHYWLLRPTSTYYSSNESKGSPLAHGRSDQIRLSDLIGCPIQRYGAADVSCGDGAVIRRVSGDQRIDPR